jgi:DNA-binding response OmpR family regulator
MVTKDKKKKVLIIEDDEQFSYVYDLKLKQEGFETVIAQDGESGVSFLEKEKPNIILLDLMLPEKDGFWVLEEIKKRQNVKGVSVIVLSNLGQKTDIDRALGLGASEYLIKSDTSVQNIIDTVKRYA